MFYTIYPLYVLLVFPNKIVETMVFGEISEMFGPKNASQWISGRLNEARELSGRNFNAQGEN